MKASLTVVLLASLCFAFACSDEPKPAIEAEPPHTPAPKPPKPVADTIDPTPEQVPIPEDFEEEAAQEVSDKNLSAQLDALEQEITADSL
jgi:hypothetical protein